MKIVVLDGYTLNPGDISWEALSGLGELTVYDRTPEDQVVERACGAKAVYTNKTPLSEETLGQLKELKFIGVLATGYNIVDVAAAKSKDIVVTNIPTYGTTAVAQMVFALLLEMCHHVGAHSESVKAGAWSGSKDWCFWNYPLVELAGKTMGILGFGRIGRTVACIAQAFGMDVVFYDAVTCEPPSGSMKQVPLDELYARADVISLHCPLFDNTKGIINRKSIEKMKDGVMLVNTSRGPLVVEEDLAEALRTGKVASAGLDVLQEEPPSPDNPLLHAPNSIITPHISWAPKESRQRLMDIAVSNLQAFMEGEPVNTV